MSLLFVCPYEHNISNKQQIGNNTCNVLSERQRENNHTKTIRKEEAQDLCGKLFNMKRKNHEMNTK